MALLPGRDASFVARIEVFAKSYRRPPRAPAGGKAAAIRPASAALFVLCMLLPPRSRRELDALVGIVPLPFAVRGADHATNRSHTNVTPTAGLLFAQPVRIEIDLCSVARVVAGCREDRIACHFERRSPALRGYAV